jgi:hypothetical protein
MIDKTYFRLEAELLELDCVKTYLANNPDLNIQGLLMVSDRTIRIFFYKDVDNKKVMSSELIEF